MNKTDYTIAGIDIIMRAVYINTLSIQHLLHVACVTHTSECIHHTNTMTNDDTTPFQK